MKLLTAIFCVALASAVHSFDAGGPHALLPRFRRYHRHESYGPEPTHCSRIHPTITTTVTTATDGTSIVHTPSGFTPIRSVTDSFTPHPYHRRNEATPAATNHGIGGHKDDPVPESGSYVPKDDHYGWKHEKPTPDPAWNPLCPSLSTITKTVTASIARATYYEACGADNTIGAVGPNDGYSITIVEIDHQRISNYTILVSDSYECCVACQIAQGCLFSRIGGPPGRCYLYLDERRAECNGGKWDGSTYGYNPAYNLGPDNVYIVSNGPCGQLVYAGEVDR
ncbi:MAG: hypothetical protein LQ351_007507 [Letrouitia transgressa]|nr:MAG: hypothetical protein LQ351_007507 [Letrouitia transgressa]